MTHNNYITTCKISIWFRESPDHKQTNTLIESMTADCLLSIGK